MKTRKSSCVNARGIPTRAYQVLHLFPKVGYPPWPGLPGGGGTWGGAPLPVWGTPGQVWWGGTPQPGLMGGYPRWGTPKQGVPLTRSDGGTQGGVPPLPGWGVPLYPPARSDGGYLRWGTPPPVWTDRLMDGWTDRHVSKHYLPVVLRTRSAMKKFWPREGSPCPAYIRQWQLPIFVLTEALYFLSWKSLVLNNGFLKFYAIY